MELNGSANLVLMAVIHYLNMYLVFTICTGNCVVIFKRKVRKKNRCDQY